MVESERSLSSKWSVQRRPLSSKRPCTSWLKDYHFEQTVFKSKRPFKGSSIFARDLEIHYVDLTSHLKSSFKNIPSFLIQDYRGWMWTALNTGRKWTVLKLENGPHLKKTVHFLILGQSTLTDHLQVSEIVLLWYRLLMDRSRYHDETMEKDLNPLFFSIQPTLTRDLAV